MDCGLEVSSCDWLIQDLGPPPDMILRIPPPPPLPSFVDDDFLRQVFDIERSTYNDSQCHWCRWARSNDVTVVEFPETEAALQDTWFFIILASCLMLTLGAVLAGLIYLRVHGRTLKTAWESNLTHDNSSSVNNSSTLGSSKSCEPVRYSSANDNISSSSAATSQQQQHQHQHQQQQQQRATRALWAGVKTTQGNHYTITHAQPVEQKRQVNDYGDSVGYTTLAPQATSQDKIYYCSTDIMVGLPHSTLPSPPLTQVTSLDDIEPGSSKNPIYVNTPVYGTRIKQDVSAPVLCATSNFPPLNSRAAPMRV